MEYELKKLQRALKFLMKNREASYRSLGKKLQVSTATIKRRLNGSGLTIQQLVELADALSVSFYELIEISKQNARLPHSFTAEQEEILSSKFWIILLFRLILTGKDFHELKSQLKLTEKDLRSALGAFEKVGLVKLLPGDRIVPMVRFPFKWKIGGPLETTYNNFILDNITLRIKKIKEEAGLNKQFELALNQDAYLRFCTEINEVFVRYRALSEIQLNSKIDVDQIVSGILFIDRFSLWDRFAKIPIN